MRDPKEAVDEARAAVRVRSLELSDLDEVVRIDAAHTGDPKPDYWRRVFDDYVGQRSGKRTFGLTIDAGRGLAGFLFGEVRAFEFGSEAAGWIFAVGVDPEGQRRGTATSLVTEARRHFAALGIRQVRTMVRRNDIPILSFFRASGFVGGPFAQLEIDLDEEDR